jgi:hypothetical protein
MKHLKHASETLEKKDLKILENHCNHRQHPDKTNAMFV